MAEGGERAGGGGAGEGVGANAGAHATGHAGQQPGLDESIKRGAHDVCVYVTRPGESTKRMVAVKPSESWQAFLHSVSARLDVQVGRVFNSHDEIKRVADLVQGDILFVKAVSGENMSPGSTQGHGLKIFNWMRIARLALLQCVDGYMVTEAIKKSKYSETLRARRVSDGLHVIIKRFSARPGLSVATLTSVIPECWSIRHPHFAHNLDVLVTKDLRRPLGGSSAIRRAKRTGRCEVIAIVQKRLETSLENVLADHIKLQKPIPTDQIVSWVIQILMVLQYMHTEMRVAHRNVKLSNVLISEEGYAQLNDVALPNVDPGATSYHMRSMCRNCCALRKGQDAAFSGHVSPEALQSGCTSEKDDIWALGCVLTELVTQKMVSERGSGEPFSKSQGAVSQAVAEVTIKDTKLGKFCRVLLEIDPCRRPSASETLLKHVRGFTCVTSLEVPCLSASEMSNVSSLGKSNDVPTLISAILKDGSFEACEAAAERLNEILYHEPAKRICMKDIYATPFGRMSGMAALCHCVAKGSPLAQQRSASAIRNALLDDAMEQHAGLAEIQALVGGVIMGTPQTQSNAAAALANVCATRAQARDHLKAAGGMGALAALIASCTSENMTGTGLLNSAILEAASAVRNACIGHAANRNDLMKSQGVSSFVKILACDSHVPTFLREKQMIMHEQVAGALRNACNQHTGNCMQFAEADGVNCMMRLLASASVNVQEEVVGLIRNACVGYQGNKNQLTFCGAFWSFAQMLNQMSLADSVREEIVSAVHYGTVGHEVNKQAAGEAGLIRALVAMLHAGQNEGSMRAKQEIAACLRIMCDGSESNSAEMVKCSGVSGLLDLMATGPIEAKEESIAAIANACCAYSQNLEYISEKARADLHEVMLSPAFGDEAKLYAKCILISFSSSRQRVSRISSLIDDNSALIDPRSTSWCPHRTEKGKDQLHSNSFAIIPTQGHQTRELPRIAQRRGGSKQGGSKFSFPEERRSWRWPEIKPSPQTFMSVTSTPVTGKKQPMPAQPVEANKVLTGMLIHRNPAGMVLDHRV
jgi:serine/threonine protein kinase